MADFLFLTWNGGGATVPVRAIARELLRTGHGVRVLGHAVQSEQFAQAGIPFAPYARSGGFEVGTSPRNLMALMRSRDAARDVDDELDARPVDLVVGDVLLTSTLSALHRRGQRYALLESTFDTLLRARMRPLGGVLGLFGLPVRAGLDGADAVIVASAAELDPRAGADAQHVGAMVSATAARAAEPTVLLSLSTFPFPHLVGTWQRLLMAVDGLPARVIGTTGPALDPAALDAPPNVDLRGWVDHSDIMPTVSAAVTHGGHGTTIAALAHGIPVLVLPLDETSDQRGIGRIVEAAGVGITLSRRSSPTRMRAAIERLLDDDDLHRRASDLGERIRAYGGAAAGAAALTKVAMRG